MAQQDFLAVKVREIQERIAELRPLVAEFERLEAADRALNGTVSAKPVKRRGRPRKVRAT